ncbi:MAG TPA: hypothetical protein VJ782_08905 [Aeromicrobium sp.]|nr:hypothetical protein [Aeromicrobium sp.]
MAAPTVQQILDGYEARLKAIQGLRVADFGPNQITPPQAIVTIPPIDYRRTFGAKRWALKPTITVLVSAALDRAGQRALAQYADHTGDRSVFQAFAGGGNGVDLGITGVVCYITDFEPLGWEQVGQIGYYGGVFNTVCEAPGV